MRVNRMLQIIALASVAALLAAVSARADGGTVNVTLNTSSLSGTQTLVFGITDGDGPGDNSVALSDFNFGGGSAEGSANYIGSGISGDLSSAIAMDDSGFSALFEQQINVGSSLSFVLNTSDNFAGGTPDAFAMYLCDATLSTCYSDDALSGAMLILNLTGGTVTPSGFILNGASDQDLPAPVVTGVTAPEPTSILLLGFGLALLALMNWARVSRAVAKRRLLT
jgi:PEP-CTERM motif